MKRINKILSGISAAMLGAVAIVGTALTANAAVSGEVDVTVSPVSEQLDLTASRNAADGTITVSFDATKGSSVGGVIVTNSWDTALSDFSSYFSKFYSTDIKPTDNNTFVCSDAGAEGKGVLTFTYSLLSDFELDKDYTFSYYFEEIYDAGSTMSAFDIEGKTVTVTYRENSATEYCNVTFVSNGTKVGEQSVESGKTAEKPADPERDGYTFAGWSANGTDKFDFTPAITQDLTLYALWTKDTATGNKTVDLSKVKITKTLNANTELDEDFTFKLDYVGVTPDESGAKVTKAPAIESVTVTKSGSVSLGNADFEIGGVYEFKVTEVKGNTPGMKYDDTEYRLLLEIEEDKDGNLVLDKFIVKKGDEKSELSFENSYAPTDTLTVSKKVEGESENPLNQQKKFKFSIIFTAPAVTNDQNVKVTVNNAENELVYGTPYEFTLGNGDELSFTNIPEGTTYSLTEEGEEYYTPSAVLTYGDKSELVNGKYAESLTVSETIVDGGNSAEITNTYSITPPTGVKVSHEMIMIIAFVLAAAAGGFAINRRLRRSED